MASAPFDADVAVVGSGFGGAVAALRFTEAGERVLVLERGGEVSRAAFEADLDALWVPERNAFGFHEVRRGGGGVVPWLGAAVGGGSHVYAGTLMRRLGFDDLPGGITAAEMDRHYAEAERMLAAVPYPDWPPYSTVRATRLLLRAGERLARERPDLVRAHGPVPLGISFAAPGEEPGRPFTNAHGAPQRTQDPREQALLGGDIDAKNTLDRNYLWVARARGARVLPLHEVVRLASIPGGFRLECRAWQPEKGTWRGRLRRLLPWAFPPNWRERTFTARRVVVSAGAIGSTELLLRSREQGGLEGLSPALGSRYGTNGDWLGLVVASPWRLLALSWAGFAALAGGLALGSLALALPGAAAYWGGLALAGPLVAPDLGTTTSDFLELAGADGGRQGLLVEGGRYPTPDKGLVAILLSALGAWSPRRWLAISRAFAWLRLLVPPFAALARTWPLPLLLMGRDRALGEIRLEGGRAVARLDLAANRDHYARAAEATRLVARAARALPLPNLLYLALGKQEVPHSLGGVPMGEGPTTGVVDDCGRVFGQPDLLVLDGSILPTAVGPNPALTILALAERAMEKVVRQLRETGRIEARE